LSKLRARLVGAALILLVGAPTTQSQSQSQSQDFRCDYGGRFDCTASGCTKGEVGFAYLLVPHVDSLMAATISADGVAKLPAIRRCDAKGCSAVTVRASLSGAFVNVAQYDGTYFLKISTIDLGDGLRPGSFVEVASQFLSTITYFGSCPAVVK
jgi:hypothetical protein